jgi:hypothetical protein
VRIGEKRPQAVGLDRGERYERCPGGTRTRRKTHGIRTLFGRTVTRRTALVLQVNGRLKIPERRQDLSKKVNHFCGLLFSHCA